MLAPLKNKPLCWQKSFSWMLLYCSKAIPNHSQAGRRKAATQTANFSLVASILDDFARVTAITSEKWEIIK